VARTLLSAGFWEHPRGTRDEDGRFVCGQRIRDDKDHSKSKMPIQKAGHLREPVYPITVACSGRILYITRTSPGLA
jgi:hypothetical protein